MFVDEEEENSSLSDRNEPIDDDEWWNFSKARREFVERRSFFLAGKNFRLLKLSGVGRTFIWDPREDSFRSNPSGWTSAPPAKKREKKMSFSFCSSRCSTFRSASTTRKFFCFVLLLFMLRKQLEERKKILQTTKDKTRAPFYPRFFQFQWGTHGDSIEVTRQLRQPANLILICSSVSHQRWLSDSLSLLYQTAQHDNTIATTVA